MGELVRGNCLGGKNPGEIPWKAIVRGGSCSQLFTVVQGGISQG